MKAVPGLLLASAVLASGHGSHSPIGQQRSSRSAVVEDPSVHSTALGFSRVLRGGQAAAAAAAADAADADFTPSRMRLAVASGNSADASLVEVHPETLEALGLASGDCVLVRGRKMRRTACIVSAVKELAAGEARVSEAAMHNVKLEVGDELVLETITPEEGEPHTLPEAERLLALPFEEDVKGFDGDVFDAALKPFLKGQERPFSLGDTIFTTAEGDDERTIRWKVMEMEPAHGDTHAVVGPGTQVFPDGDPLTEEDVQEEEIVGYEDIAGLDTQIGMIQEPVHLPLLHPEVFDRLGVPPPRGMLLHGPPGSGKTLLGKAIKTEVGVYFKQLNGPEVMSKRSGESEAGLRKVFEEAKENAPAIIFIDEVDAITPKREKAQGEVERRIVSQLLTLLDGLGRDSRVMVVAGGPREQWLKPWTKLQSSA